MTQHLHSTHVPGCYRCELREDEARDHQAAEARAEAERRYNSAALHSDLTYPAHALESHRRAAFVAGAEWAAGRAEAPLLRQAQADAYQRGVDDWADEQGRTVPNPYRQATP